jgi:hypothetical protein
MNQFIPDRLTKVTAQQFIEDMKTEWPQSFASTPTKSSVLVLTAQSILETGWWKYCHNYNYGNAKSVAGDGFDYSFFACDEVLYLPVVQKLAAASTKDAPCKIVSVHPDNHTAVIWFYPDHPGCRFRAFCVKDAQGNIDEKASSMLGMESYLTMLYKRFGSAWPAVLAGDPRRFVQELKAQGYFTAPEKPYEDSVAAIFEQLQKTITF